MYRLLQSSCIPNDSLFPSFVDLAIRSMGLSLVPCLHPVLLDIYTYVFEINSGRPTRLHGGLLCRLLGLALKQQREGFTSIEMEFKWEFAFALSCLTYWSSAAAMGFTLILILFCIASSIYRKKQAIQSVFRAVPCSRWNRSIDNTSREFS